MGIHIARFEQESMVKWGLVHNRNLHAVPGVFDSLAAFLASGKDLAFNLDTGGDSVPVDSVRLLNPVTAPCNVICQGLNYDDHRAETGSITIGERAPFNLVFMKASSSLSGPRDDVVRPKGVTLLDYELELGLVIGAEITSSTEITDANIFDYVAGVVISNDVSARDVQIPQGQWFKGKSYRTFCPVGPYLYLFDGEDIGQLLNIDIQLEVNGEIRQKANTGQLLYGPSETLSELSGLMDLHPGDLVQTGTPGGVAVKAPSAHIQRIARLLFSEAKLMKIFVKKQLQNPNFLKDGDLMKLTMRSPDGSIDLGVMKTRIVPETSGDKHEIQ